MGIRTRVMSSLGWVRKRNVSPKADHPLAAVKRALKETQIVTVFDVGAFDGCTAIGYRKAFKEAAIHSFEPSPEAYAALVERFKEDSQVVPVNTALADAPGTASFQLNNAGVTNSLLEKDKRSDEWVDHTWTDNTATVEVKVDTLDNYCEREGIRQIDLLKIDAQGADLKVLQGAGRMLREGRIYSIFIETCIVPLYDGQGELHEVCALMHGHGYCLFDLLAPSHAPSGQLMWCDLLFTRGSGIL